MFKFEGEFIEANLPDFGVTVYADDINEATTKVRKALDVGAEGYVAWHNFEEVAP